MHLGKGLSPTQTEHETEQLTVAVVKTECMKFLHSVLAVASVAVSFGTCALLLYKAKQEEQPLPKQKQKLYIYLIRLTNIGSCL